MADDKNTKGRILVADDDPAILRLVTAVLEKEGYAVVGARDGREAYKALQDDVGFTAAVFDVVMPQIAGPEIVRYMKTEKRFMKIPIMMMTAEQDPKLPSDSFAAGAVVFLPKPFTTAQLRNLSIPRQSFVNRSIGDLNHAQAEPCHFSTGQFFCGRRFSGRRAGGG